MKCEVCGEREASVHYKEMMNDQIRELHLCERCAEERGFGSSPGEDFSISDLLGSMAEDESAEVQAKGGAIVCPRCGLTYPEFKASGRLGCSDCYLAFRLPLIPLLRRIHGSDRHAGKLPHGTGEAHRRMQEIRMMKRRLERCVEREAFEEAADLRDRIRGMEEADD